jgi:pimeloyl-ACP methyl ester carboxylesterase
MQSLHRDGIALRYERAAAGMPAVDLPPILLVHGWCCDHSYFAPQFEHFARRGHDVVAMDLRGHGESDKPHQSYGIEVFTDDLAWICEQLRLTRPVVIGHSMGGLVAFDLACRYPGLPGAIVMLDSSVAPPATSHAGMMSFLEKLRGPDYRAAMRDFINDVMFLSTDEAGRKARITEQMAATPHHVVLSAYEGLSRYSPGEATGSAFPPSLYIAASEAQPRSDAVRMQELMPQMFYGKAVGTGHFCQLEVPEQVNAMIDRFLALAAPAPAGSPSP